METVSGLAAAMAAAVAVGAQAVALAHDEVVGVRGLERKRLLHRIHGQDAFGPGGNGIADHGTGPKDIDDHGQPRGGGRPGQQFEQTDTHDLSSLDCLSNGRPV